MVGFILELALVSFASSFDTLVGLNPSDDASALFLFFILTLDFGRGLMMTESSPGRIN